MRLDGLKEVCDKDIETGKVAEESLVAREFLADFVPRAPVPTEHTFLRIQWTSIRLMFIGRHFLCKRWGGQIDPQAQPRIHLSPDM